MRIGTARMEAFVPLVPAMRNPESNPLMVMLASCAGMQGAANVDCVALWLPAVTVRRG